jgi:steroid delta-isomerase-like uncharacterized protein
VKLLTQVMASRSTYKEGQNKQVVRQFFDAFNRHDTERMGQIVSSAATTNYSFHFAGIPTTDWNGRKQFIAAVINAFPDIHHNILDVVAEGDKVAVRFTITGTPKGEYQGIPPTGKEVSIDCINFLTVLDGKIVEEWSNSDMMGLMQQIGAIAASSSRVPSPDSGRDRAQS